MLLSHKLEICDKIRDGFDRKTVIKDYNLKSSSHLTKILQKEKQIREKASGLNKKVSKNVFNLKNEMFPKVEKAIIIWMKQMRANNVPLSGDVIREKARKFAEGLKITNFRGSEGWLQNLRKRHNLLFVTEHGESGSVDKEVVKNWSEKLNEITENYEPKNVYNLDESALFWRLLPSKTYSFGNHSKSGTKKWKTRITITLIVNADGSDKKCSVIGVSKCPRAIRGIKNLPVDYYNQKNAWMTTDIFEQIIEKLNKEMRKKKRKILLFVDNFKGHNRDIELSNIKLIFLPENTTSVLQPLDQGIIHSFKCFYRKELVAQLISQLENGSTIKQIDFFSMFGIH